MLGLNFFRNIAFCLLLLVLQQEVSRVYAGSGGRPSARPSLDSAADYANRPGPWDEPELDSLLEANKVWVNRMVANRPNYFDVHKKGHYPKIMWIGCSDARVPASEAVDQAPGGVFVHRNVANQVVATDFNLMSVLQYAVEALNVRHIVVCGHYDCGGVKAALSNKDHSAPLENWVRNIRDVYRAHSKELNAITDPLQKQRRLVELNVVEQCMNVLKSASVQKRRSQTLDLVGKDGSKIYFAEPRVHGMVYEPTTGKLTKLDLQKYIDQLEDVYDLFPVE